MSNKMMSTCLIIIVATTQYSQYFESSRELLSVIEFPQSVRDHFGRQQRGLSFHSVKKVENISC